MLGTVVRAPHGIPVARVMGCIEAVIEVGPVSDTSAAEAFVGTLLGPFEKSIWGACDNRDLFTLRPAGPRDLEQVYAAVRIAGGVERQPHTADWAVAAYYDASDVPSGPRLFVSCALGRRSAPDGAAGIAIAVGVAEGAPWPDLFRLAMALADGWPGLWRSINVGYRFCPLLFNGFHHAHQAIHRMAKRMPFVDVGDTLGIHTAHWTRMLRTVSWATLVAPDLAARCAVAPGEEWDAITVSALASGGMCVLVPAGPGDRWPSPGVVRGHAQADRVLRAVRATDDVVFLPPWDGNMTREWLTRWQDSIGGDSRSGIPRLAPLR
jgi:hypothetical protein